MHGAKNLLTVFIYTMQCLEGLLGYQDVVRENCWTLPWGVAVRMYPAKRGHEGMSCLKQHYRFIRWRLNGAPLKLLKGGTRG